MHTKNTDQNDMPAVVGAALLSGVTHRVSLWHRADLPSLLPARGGGGGIHSSLYQERQGRLSHRDQGSQEVSCRRDRE